MEEMILKTKKTKKKKNPNLTNCKNKHQSSTPNSLSRKEADPLIGFLRERRMNGKKERKGKNLELLFANLMP